MSELKSRSAENQYHNNFIYYFCFYFILISFSLCTFRNIYFENVCVCMSLSFHLLAYRRNSRTHTVLSHYLHSFLMILFYLFFNVFLSFLLHSSFYPYSTLKITKSSITFLFLVHVWLCFSFGILLTNEHCNLIFVFVIHQYTPSITKLRCFSLENNNKILNNIYYLEIN